MGAAKLLHGDRRAEGTTVDKLVLWGERHQQRDLGRQLLTR